ncbi:MAG: Na/Pi cotransporter family protein [Clostridia bacterium]|jgi:phosphate:Na+ symporter|nr:Na/Pi cotransporter family protein [Clostridia bacterium]
MVNSLLGLSGGDVLALINSLFFILGGIAVFMVGMNMMGASLETAAGKSMRRLMGKATKNRFLGVGTGAAVTAIVNSSAATTVMIVGFVNVGLMTLAQAASVIMGANIGTTISAFIMALSAAGGMEFSVAAVFALLAFIGFVLTLVGKNDKIKRIGNIFEGVGLIFVGLNVMSNAVSDLMEGNVGEVVASMFIALGNGKASLSWEIPVLFILGALLTAAMQSSAALTAIVISLAAKGLISMQMAMCIILGANVGTCLTSLISSMGASVNARRAAMVHLLFNVAGCFIFIWPVAFAGNYIAKFLSSFISDTEWQIAIFHMVFNLITTALLLPFVSVLVKLACLIVPDKKGAESTDEYERLDKRLLKTPAIAVGQVRKELVQMGGFAFENYKRALDMLLTLDLTQKEDFAETEKHINDYNSFISSFLVKLSLLELGETDEKKVSSFYHVASDFERIGDYAENIVEYAEKLAVDKFDFSEHAKAEILDMDGHLTNLYGYVTKVFADIDLSLIDKVENEERLTDETCEKMQQAHLRRMNEGRCNAEVGAVYLQLAINMERIGDHMHNIANSVKTYHSETKNI